MSGTWVINRLFAEGQDTRFTSKPFQFGVEFLLHLGVLRPSMNFNQLLCILFDIIQSSFAERGWLQQPERQVYCRCPLR